MANVVVTINSTQDVGDLSFANWGKGRVSREVAKLIEGLGTGSFTGSLDVTAAAVAASGTLTISGGSGAVGGTIGGQLVTVTWATSDTLSAAALAAAINANATTLQYVVATSLAGVVTITSLVPGTVGNGVTLVASGTGVSASGARLASGAGQNAGNVFAC